MKDRFRQSMAWLHTWLGLLFGWLLYFIFITGTLGYLDTEIDRWMRPELPVASYPPSQKMAIDRAQAFLQSHAAHGQRWTLTLPIDRNEPYLHVSWQAARAGAPAASGTAYLDPGSGRQIETRDTGGGQALYQMHWRLHYLPPLGSLWIVGIATLALLLALVTGIVVHRKILADFFTFRPRKGQRSWLDAHNVASVVSLPFQLMITYSGLIFLMFSFMPLVAAAWYGPGQASQDVFLDEVFPPLASAPAAGRSAMLLPLDRLWRDAQDRWGPNAVAALEVQDPNDAHARVHVIGNFAAGPLRATSILTYDGVSGERLAERQAWQSGPKALRDAMLGLHEGMFAPPALRAIYVLSGLLGAVMIATGMVLWCVKRRQRAERGRDMAHAGLRLAERLNVAVFIGLPVAIGAYFWANRLLPTGMAHRAELEMHALFAAWLLMFILAALRPALCAWKEQAIFAAVAFGLLPVLNAATTSRHLLQSVPDADWVMAGFDLASLAIGAAFAGLAWKVKRHQARRTLC
ncbi:PepSY-associated TM helix domain-containing protein [Variovorax sp.]|uniref:PepSY-associated TM helix domain-containing protein n=1 Tax=Variovorax sp. TaxID=1871043 RepID=UPI002D4BE6A4|nr:PepSY-associated TM helix domain-containing protein [Variovorax sp.]HYP82790.1 PepSY-associated TM helix domain-containing protein [Variovorax sp.]